MRYKISKAACAVFVAVSLSACVGSPPSGLGSQELRKDRVERNVAQFTLRLRNINCTNAQTGSGFAIDPHTLVTNRHVVEGANILEVNTWDGETLQVGIAEMSGDQDLAIVRTDERLPNVATLAKDDPLRDEEVTVVGYPEGGRLTFVKGRVLDYQDDARLGGHVLRTRATVKVGNSGGPLVDKHGEVVGVIFAIEVATSFGLAIPVSTLHDMLENESDRLPIVSTCAGITG